MPIKLNSLEKTARAILSSKVHIFCQSTYLEAKGGEGGKLPVVLVDMAVSSWLIIIFLVFF